MANDPIVDLKLNLDISGVNNALYNMIGNFKGTDKEFAAISASIDKNAKILEASIKRFGPASKEASNASNTLQKSLTNLAAYGIDPVSDDFKKLESSLPQISRTMDNTANSVKKSNQQWTNFALVIQDLPYGFRGIQNNLPALMGGIAGMAGPLYFVGSAVIALFTAWDQGSFKAKNATDDLAEAIKRKNEIVGESAKKEGEALVEMREMSTVFKGVKDGSIDAKDALYLYNETLGKTFGNAKSLNEAESLFISKSGTYVKAIALRAMADEKYADAVAAFREGRLAAGKDQTTFLQKLASGMDALDKVGIMSLDPAAITKFFTAFSTNLAETQKVLVTDAVSLAGSQFELFTSQAEQFVKERNKLLSKAGIKPIEGAKVDTTEIDQQKKVNEQVIQNLIDAKKQEIKIYEDDALKKYEVSKELALLEAKLALEKIKNAKNTPKQIAALEKGVYQEYANQILIIDMNMQEQLLNQDAKARKEKKKREDKETKELQNGYKQQLKDFDEFYNNKQDLATGDRLAKKSIYEQESGDLLYMLNNNFITYDDYLSRMSNVFKNWTNNNTAITKEALSNIMNFGRGIMSALGPSLDLLLDKGASINEVLDKAFKDLVKQITKVTIAAAVAVTLMAAMGLVNGKDIGKVFGMLFSQGMGLGSLGFAAPTAAASSTPSSMSSIDTTTSASGMSFVLKGQDLLLSVNRAQKASTLKGQNISLG